MRSKSVPLLAACARPPLCAWGNEVHFVVSHDDDDDDVQACMAETCLHVVVIVLASSAISLSPSQVATRMRAVFHTGHANPRLSPSLAREVQFFFSFFGQFFFVFLDQ